MPWLRLHTSDRYVKDKVARSEGCSTIPSLGKSVRTRDFGVLYRNHASGRVFTPTMTVLPLK